MVRGFLVKLSCTHDAGDQSQTFRCNRLCFHGGNWKQMVDLNHKQGKYKVPGFVEIKKGITIESFDAMVKACMNLRYRTILIFFMATGIWAFELDNLRVGDIDTFSSEILIGRASKGNS
jgi:hypothetical protein